MKRNLGLLLGCCLAVGCVHAKHVNEGGADQSSGAAGSGAEANATPPKDRPVAHRSATGGAGKAGTDENGAEPGHPPLAFTPAELRVPGGQDKIINALANRGYLKSNEDGKNPESLAAATARFQKSEALAPTGFADAETLRHLGLDPKEINRSEKPRNSAGGDKAKAKEEAKK